MDFFFGNLHSQTGYSDGEGTPEEAFRWAAGVGVRYFSGFGPLRLDIALPLDKRN